MKIKNTVAAIIIAIAASTASNAEVASKVTPIDRPEPENIVARMISNHDENRDGALDNAELAASIESLFDHRNQVVRERRDAMVAKGFIAAEKADNGFITLTPMPDDAAAFLINGHDSNDNDVLEADELLASTRDFRQLNLGYRPGFARES